MSSEKELTPEEKLLALIQQDKRPSAAPAVPAPALSPLPPLAAVPSAAPESPRVVTVPAAAPLTAPASAAVPPVAVRVPQKPLEPRSVREAPVAADVTPAAQSQAPRVVPPSPAPAKAAAPAAQISSTPAPVATPAEPARKPEEIPDAGRKLKLASPPVAAGPAPMRAAPLEPLAKPVAPVPEAATAAALPPAAPVPAKSRPKPARAHNVASAGWPLVNRVLAFVVLVLMVVVVYSVASIQSGIERDLGRQKNEAGELAVVPVGDEPLKLPELDGILQKVAVRDIFQPLEAPGVTNNVPGGAGPKVEFKLVGVSIDPKAPEATMAILKNKASSQTFFVKVGEALGDTGYILGRVLADHVILKKQKQEIEVR